MKEELQIDLSNYSFENIRVVGIGKTGINVLSKMVSLVSEFKGLEYIAIDSDHRTLSSSRIKKKIYIKLDSEEQKIEKKSDLEELHLSELQINSLIDYFDECEAIFFIGNLEDRYVYEIVLKITELSRSLNYFTVGFFIPSFSFKNKEIIRQENEHIVKLIDNINTIFFLPDRYIKSISRRILFKTFYNSRFDGLRYGLQEFLETILRPASFKDTHIIFELIHRKIGTFFRGEGKGNNRALKAVENAIQNLLSSGFHLDQAEMFFVLIKSSKKFKFSEVNEILSYIMDNIPKNKRVFHSLNLDLTKKYNAVRVTVYPLFSKSRIFYSLNL